MKYILALHMMAIIWLAGCQSPAMDVKPDVNPMDAYNRSVELSRRGQVLALAMREMTLAGKDGRKP